MEIDIYIDHEYMQFFHEAVNDYQSSSQSFQS